MDITNTEELVEGISSIISYLSDRDEEFYVALEVAHQLRDEINQALPDDE